MIKNAENEPWSGLSEGVAGLIEPELDAIAAETLAAIAREVPEYARPLEGSFGRGIRTGVEEALRQFVALIRDPEGGRGVGREVYVALGRGELRQGRTLDSLQAAYRVGARVAWRRISAAGRRADLDPEELSLLAEAIFAYIDELSADAVEGYTEAQAEVEDVRRRRRRELAALLLREPPPPPRTCARSPRRPAGRCRAASPPSPAPSPTFPPWPGGCRPSRWRRPSTGRAACWSPIPTGRAAARRSRAAAGGRTAALGPAGPLGELGASWRLACLAVRAVEAGALPSGELLRVEDRLGDLLLIAGGAAVERIAARRLAPLESLTEKAAERMRLTALAYVRHGGNSVAMAGELHVHPQTARYRIARLRELLGGQLDDPDARFELEAALRLRRISGAGLSAAS